MKCKKSWPLTALTVESGVSDPRTTPMHGKGRTSLPGTGFHPREKSEEAGVTIWFEFFCKSEYK